MSDVAKAIAKLHRSSVQAAVPPDRPSALGVPVIFITDKLIALMQEAQKSSQRHEWDSLDPWCVKCGIHAEDRDGKTCHDQTLDEALNALCDKLLQYD